MIRIAITQAPFEAIAEAQFLGHEAPRLWETGARQARLRNYRGAA
jgi:hypothetical protein